MQSNARFSCYVIGATTLPINCAEILLRAGHDLLGVISNDDAIAQWALTKGIPHLKPDAGLKARLAATPFDYLFSIVNEHILDEEVLAMPRKLAINYHDAPLPRYAGTHATSWALLNRETSHGTSWHVASKMVDAGDILQQRRIEIAPGETAFSLNTKCYEASIQSFAGLVDDLASSRAAPVKQDLTQRSFFPRFKRPPAGSLISWDRPADELAALIRALDFGPHPNPLGAAKFAVGTEFIVARELKVLDAPSRQPPGTIVAIDKARLVVSTTTDDIALARLYTTGGRALTPDELAIRHRLGEGTRLVAVDEPRWQALDALTGLTAKHEGFWVDALARLEPVALPYAAPTAGDARPARTQRHTMSLAPDVLRFFAGCDAAADPAETVVAAWLAYLERISGATAFDVGFTDPALRSKTAGLEGFFAPIVPLRCEIGDERDFAAHLTAHRARLEQVRRRVTYPHDVALRYPALRGSAETFANLPVRVEIVAQLDAAQVSSPGHLTLAIEQGGTRCDWIYDPAVFSDANIERMVRQFATFAGGLAAEPARALGRQPLLSAAEQHQILVEWNDTSADYPAPVCLHQLFEAQVARTPDATALVWKETRLTYRQLDQRANQLAHHLRQLGVGPDTMVGICVERSPEMLIGLLGILKAGGAYVPLDPAYPADRLRFVIEDASAPVLVTQQRLRAVLGPELPSCKLVCLDTDWESIATRPTEALRSEVTPQHLAYVIYTSGSTGKPKGVAIEHHSPVTLVQWAHTILSPQECAGVSLVTSICFNLSIWEMFVPLSRGGKIILAENALHLPEQPAAGEVTLVNTVPSAIRELVRRRKLPSSVRVVCLAGEPLTVELVNEIYAVPTVEKVYDLYGPSETTTYSTWALRRADAPYTIGRPIGNTQVYLLDRHDQPVPVGLPGQILIGGDGVARGYHGRPELTAERFVPDPFSTRPNARLYKTGDLAKFFPDGEIELLGRMDHQVKIRGFRIELGEVESVLRQCAGVRACVAVAREDVPGDKRLIAYLAGRSDELPDDAELRRALKQKLPDFMVPSAFVKLDALPLNPSGKIDRKALPKPDVVSTEARESYVAPRDEVEKQLVALWEQILGARPVGIHDDYFALGGDSLKAVVLFSQIDDILHKKLGLATLFQAPTIAQLAELVRGRVAEAAWSSLVPIQPKGSKPPFFCIHARGGNVLFYRDLANRLGDDQPFYGIQPQGLDGKQPYLTRVEDMAARYIREIRTIQPRGPYFLGGSSFGGTAAFEMAHQLHAAGEEVAVLAVFDTGGPDYPRPMPATTFTRYQQKVQTLTRRVQDQVWALRALDSGTRMDYLSSKARKLQAKYQRELRRRLIKLAARLPASLARSLLPSHVNVRWALLEFEKAIKQALAGYTHRVYPGRMVLFRASKQPLGIYPDPALGWRDLVAGGLEIHEVPGSHGAIVVEPRVRLLAEILKTCLAEAQAGPPIARAVARSF